MTKTSTVASTPPPVVRTYTGLRAQIAEWRKSGARIGFVPTMGALHAGHLSLIDLAGKQADKVVVSIFVNPTQFAPHEDFAAYPRDEAADLAKMAGSSAALAYCPSVSEIYPAGDATVVTVGGPAKGLESDARPHFFAGVATVVSRLLIHCAPDLAVFGEKDYQQLLVIRRMVKDLGLPVEIIGAPCIRESDGLALSSRNQYLSAPERQIAPALHRALTGLGAALKDGAPVADSIEQAKTAVLKAGFASIDYIALRNAETLEHLDRFALPARILAAARLGTTRLIDNIAVI